MHCESGLLLLLHACILKKFLIMFSKWMPSSESYVWPLLLSEMHLRLTKFWYSREAWYIILYFWIEIEYSLFCLQLAECILSNSTDRKNRWKKEIIGEEMSVRMFFNNERNKLILSSMSPVCHLYSEIKSNTFRWCQKEIQAADVIWCHATSVLEPGMGSALQ